MSFITGAGASDETLSWGPRDAPAAVIALHGRGQGVDSIRSLRDRIGLADLRWEVPVARDRAWYPQRFMDPEILGSEELEAALETVSAAVHSLVAEGFSPERIAILGFSQGACLAAQWALQHANRYAGLILFTGGFIGPDGTVPVGDGTFRGTPVLSAGPEEDAWVPHRRMRETEDTLRARGARVTALLLPPGDHEVSDPEIALARMLLTEATPRITDGK